MAIVHQVSLLLYCKEESFCSLIQLLDKRTNSSTELQSYKSFKIIDSVSNKLLSMIENSLPQYLEKVYLLHTTLKTWKGSLIMQR